MSLRDSHAFSGFSVRNLKAAQKFYGDTLGLEVEESPMGLQLKLTSGNRVFVYQKDDHQPATFTILNIPVDDIEKTVDELSRKDVKFEQYDFGKGAKTDNKGIMHGRQAGMGPDIAWFKDPSGNTLAVLQEK
jgi:catechol 2,3-dioxygenase-like lactoylglutathione lyase family enzyme